jgi:GTPase
LVDSLASTGEALLDIGQNEDGISLEYTKVQFNEYIDAVKKAADSIGADASLIYERNTQKYGSQENPPTEPYYYGHVLVRKRDIPVQDILESRVAVVGNVDAGKSTLLGCLTKDLLDDGRGKARVSLFKHKHEVESGRTSSVGSEIMGFNSRGQIVTPKLLGKNKVCRLI